MAKHFVRAVGRDVLRKRGGFLIAFILCFLAFLRATEGPCRFWFLRTDGRSASAVIEQLGPPDSDTRIDDDVSSGFVLQWRYGLGGALSIEFDANGRAISSSRGHN